MRRLILTLLVCSLAAVLSKEAWEGKLGCFRFANTREIHIADCVIFNMSSYGCRGYCESFSVPSDVLIIDKNPKHKITTIGQCCDIMSTEDVEAFVTCVDGNRTLIFKSALNCSCDYCKKY